MGKIFGRLTSLVLICCILLTGCAKDTQDKWLKLAALDTEESVEALYEKALKEDILIVYTVSTRAVQTKESFEAEYPGLYVEIRDLRSPDLVDAVENNYKSGLSDCDVVICNDNSGEFKTRLVDTSIVVPYMPADIAKHMKSGTAGNMVSFVNEAELLFYSSRLGEECPVKNIWELTENKYHGRIYMPNPLRSFSTYALCAATMTCSEELKAALISYGKGDMLPANEDAAEFFWKKAANNIVFTNSSDEVVEALSNGEADFGFAVSSKLRMRDLGYGISPAYKLEPFSGCRTSYSIMLARNSKNINSAKLFIRWLLGEADGTGEGYKPFHTPGTWSVRDDIDDATPVSLEEADLTVPDQDKMIALKPRMETFWAEIIKNSATEQ